MQTILFTVDEEILELVADNDQTFDVDATNGDDDVDDESIYSSFDDVMRRPSTADDSNDVSSDVSSLLYAVTMIQ